MIRGIGRERGASDRRASHEVSRSQWDWSAWGHESVPWHDCFKAPLWALVGEVSTKWPFEDEDLEYKHRDRS
jgi:hypothetical protein